MNYHYTNLGVVPAVAEPGAERRDALLARTGPAARAMLKQIKKLPRGQQVAALDRVLAGFEPGLPMRVRRVAEHLKKEGLSTDTAIERALALSLADATIARLKKIGTDYQRGQLTPVGMLGLGQTPPATTPERNAGDTVAQMFQGVVCSNGLQAAMTDLVGRNEGRDAANATNVGYEVAQGFAQCGSMNPTIPLTPIAPAPPEETSLVLPIAIGVSALVVVGGVVWYTTKKK